MNIIEWFDIKNFDHILAYYQLGRKGVWPKGFIPEHVEFIPNWNIILQCKMADEYVRSMIINHRPPKG